MTIVSGQGGGGKKGSKSVEDTLRSVARAVVVDAISEGPIEGLIDGTNSIYINKTPLSNIRDSSHQFRRGNPDDAPLTGITGTESYQSVGVEISQTLGAQVRTIVDQTADMARIHVAVNNLYKVNSKGALKTAEGGWRIDVRAAGKSWVEAVVMDLDGEKCTSPVQFQNNIRLADFGSGPWDIRLRARHPDRTEIKTYESLTWEGMSLVNEGKFTYPHTSVVGLDLSAEYVGSSIPTRHYHVKGRRIKVPSNYDPIARTYTGVWDGSFKVAWSNNPAWIYYDITQNRIFGLGNDMPETVTSKWKLYTIGQHCDGLVPTGYKDDKGNVVKEPRYTFNGVILNKMEAVEALRSITATWRGMGFYSASEFHVTADMAQDVSHVYGPANVVDGRFEYSNTSSKARHSVVMVRFNDANDFFEPAVEPVIDPDALVKFGWREKTVELTGCSSRSLARRYGRWITDTEQNETETVSFQVGLDSVHALPGEIIGINDPRRAEVRTSGRIASISGDVITLDAALDPAVNRTGVTLRIQAKDGTMFSRSVTINTNRLTVNVGTGNGVRFEPGCFYSISATNVAPKEFRVVSIAESDGGNTYDITALEFDRTKYARVERGITLDPLPDRVDRSKVAPVRSLTTSQRSYTDGGRVRTDISLNWLPPLDTLVREYVVTVDTPTANGVPVSTTALNSTTYVSYEPGVYTFKVRTVNAAGNRSQAASVQATVAGPTELGVGRVEGLVNAATGTSATTFTGADVRLRWRNMMAVSTDPSVPYVEQDPAVYQATIVRVYNGTKLLREQQVVGNTYTYAIDMNRADSATAGFSSARRNLRFELAVIDKQGRTSAFTTLSQNNAAPATPIVRVGSAATAVNIDWDEITDADLEGYLVWVSTNPNFDPTTTRPNTSMRGTFWAYTGAPATNYYVVVAAYDAFGREGLNYTSKISISTGVDRDDVTPPAVPTGLALSSTTNRLTASWNAGTENDIAYYDIRLSVAGGNEIGFMSQGNSYSWDMPANTAVTVRVRAVDVSGNRSNYTALVSHTTARDTTPPAVPTGLSVLPGFETFFVSWNRNSESDLSHYEVYKSISTTTPTAATAGTMVAGESLMVNETVEAATRYFWVRAVDTSGNKSAWSARVQGTTASIWTHPTDAGVPTNVAVTTRLNKDEAYITTTWTASVNAVSYEIGITEDGGNEMILGVNGTRHEFRAVKGSTYAIRVRAKNVAARPSAFSASVTRVAAVDAVPPAVPTGLSVTAGFDILILNWNANTESDFSRYEIYRSATTTAPGTATAASASVSGTSLTFAELGEAVTNHFWIRGVDTSGNKSAWSARASGTTASIWSHPDDAAVPNTPTVTTRLADDQAYITVTWNNAMNAVAYEVGVTEAGGNEVVAGAGTNRYEFQARKGISYTIRVRSINKAGRRSDFSAVATRVAAVDTTPPATPTGLSMSVGIGIAVVKWTPNAETDLSHYEVAMHSATFTTTQAPTYSIGMVASNTLTISEIPGGEYRFFRVRAIDTSGNASGWSSIVSKQVTATVEVNISTETLKGLVDATSFASNLEPVQTVPSGPLPTTKLTSAILWGGKLYRWNGTKYTASAATSDLDGKIVAGQIEVGAVGASELKAGAVLADKLAVGFGGNLVANSSFAMDIKNWTFSSGGVIATQTTMKRVAPGGTWSGPVDPVMEIFQNGTATDGWAIAYNQPTMNEQGDLAYGYPVKPGDWLEVSARVSSHRNTGELRIQWLDTNGEILGYSPVANATGVGTSKLPQSYPLVWSKGEAPAGAAYGRFWFRKGLTSSGTTSHSFLFQPMMAMSGKDRTEPTPYANDAFTYMDGDRIITGSLKARHVAAEEFITNSAQIKKAIINDAHINDLTADKLTAGSTISGSIKVGTEALTAIQTKATSGANALAKFTGAGETLPPGQVSFNFAGSSSKGGSATDTAAVNGTAAATISTATLNFNNRNDRNGTTPTAPTYSSVASDIYAYTQNTDGSVDLRFQWNYTNTNGGASDIDGFIVFVRSSTSASTYTVTGTGVEEHPVYVTKDQRSVVLSGVPADKYYTCAVRAYRMVDADVSAGGVLMSSVVKPTVSGTNPYRPSATVAITGDLTGKVNGTAASTVVANASLGASDPAVRINSGTVKIDPGLITVGGTTTLKDWRHGTDTTKINGGAIQTGTVSTGKLTVGNRGFALTDTRFEADKDTNTVTWTEGYVRYTNDAGGVSTVQIPAGSAKWTSGGPLYIFWTFGTSILDYSTSALALSDDNSVVVASYRGGLSLNINHGRTVIDGAEIRTGSIRATNLIETENLITKEGQIKELTVTNGHIKDLDAKKITANTVISDTVIVGSTNGKTLSSIKTDAASGATALGKFTGTGGTLPSGQVSFNFAGSTSKGGNATDTDKVNGTEASTVSAATLNFNSNNDRISATPTAPTHGASAADVVVHSQHTDGSVDIRYTWNYTNTAGGAADIDGFIVFIRSSTSSSTYNVTGTAADEHPIYVTKDQRSVVLTGVAADRYYTFAVRAYRIVDSDINAAGVLMSSIVKSTVSGTNPYRPSSTVAFGGNLTGQIEGTDAATVVSNAALGAQNPVTRINAGTTTIDPGKILISGTSTLKDWRSGPDLTEINGGKISANTVKANSLEIGSRNITLTGLLFESNQPSTNSLRWSTGNIRWINDIGVPTTTALSAGSVAWTSGVVYIYWAKNATALSTTTSSTTAFGTNNIVLATYEGGVKLDADYGRTIIDGAEIRTGSIRATNLIQSEALITQEAQLGKTIITDAHIKELSAATLKAGTALANNITVDGRTIASLTSDAVLDDMAILWPRVSGSGSNYLTSGETASNAVGRTAMVSRADGSSYYCSTDRLLYDPAKLYKITFSVRRSGTGKDGKMYLGMAGFAADRVTKINQSGSDSWGSQFWMCAAGVEQATHSTGYVTYSAYVKGSDATMVTGRDGTIAEPYRMLNAVRYWSPLVVFNSATADGTGTVMVLNYAKVEVVNEDAGAIVNAGSTKIDPGRIVITGSTTLADWRKGGDETRINGGVISANTIKANSLEIGSRNITLTGVQFEHNSPSSNRVSWTAGYVRWVNDSGSITSTAISASNATWTSGIIYIYWVKGATSLSTTTSQTTAFGTDNVILATYEGGTKLDADFGRTIIDGSMIKTGTMTADRVNTTSFGASGLSIFGGNLQSTNYDATAGTGWRITSGGTMRMPNAVVDTLQLKDGAVTLQWAANAYSLSVNVEYPAKMIVFTSARIMGTFSTHTTRYQCRRNGSAIDTIDFSVDEYTSPYVAIKAINVSAGTHTFDFDYTRVSGSNTTTSYNTPRIAVFGAYR